MERAAILSALAAAGLLGAAARGGDWPGWRGTARDGRSLETGLLKVWPADGPKLLWAVEDLGEGYGSPVVAGGTVYATGKVGNAEVLFAYDLDGKAKWRRECGRAWTKQYAVSRYPPTVDAGAAYLLTGGGQVVAACAATGEPEWSVDLLARFAARHPKWGWAEGLLVDGGKVICTPGAPEACVAALDKATGRTIWTTKGLDETAAYCSPILIERGDLRLVVTMTSHAVVGIDAATGQLQWRHPYRNVFGDHPVSPVYADGCLYATGGYGTGGLMLRLAPDGKSVEHAWSDKRLDCLHGGLVVVDGHVYGSGDRNRKWVCLELKTGTPQYEAAGVGPGSVAWAEGMLYCYAQKGVVGLVAARPGGHEVVSSFKVPRGAGAHYAHPVVAGGRLYIRHGKALMAYDIKAR